MTQVWKLYFELRRNDDFCSSVASTVLGLSGLFRFRIHSQPNPSGLWYGSLDSKPAISDYTVHLDHLQTNIHPEQNLNL